MHLDRYWIDGVEKPLVNGYPSRERPHQYDGTLMYREARAIKHAGRNVVCEGFLSMLYPGAGEADIAFFLEIDREEMKRRRENRYREGGNKTWNNDPEFEAMIDRAWYANGVQEWELWGECQKKMPGIIVLDGKRSPEQLLADAVEACERAGMFP
jgi:thymidylate kinase